MKLYKILTISSIFLLLIITAIPNLISEENSKTIYVDDDGGKDYTTITEALNNVSDGDTIYVYNGTYQGYFSINKSINLLGENKNGVIITSGYPNQMGLIVITADNVTVSGFNIKNSTNIYYIALQDIAPPTWVYDVAIGIIVKSNNSNITGNIISDNKGYGILLNQSHNTLVSKNEIKNHDFSCIYIKNSSNNKIIENDIHNNQRGIMFHINSTSNVLYHNNFINNTYYHMHSESNNIFYSATLKHGNYYNDYNGLDKNNDGIGDTPYNISGEKCQDIYPIKLPYYGRIVIEDFYVDEDAVIYMLWIGMIATIVFLVPIAYIWYRKTRPPK